MKYLLPLMIMLLLPLLPSCNSDKEAASTEEATEETSSEILITKQQFESGGMKIGNPAPYNFQQSIKANGYVAPSPGGQAKVSTPITGRVKLINFNIGDRVKKGQLLFTLESKEIIMLQQEYAESFSQLKSIQKTYDRQKTLSEENVSSEKDFLKAESDYMGIRAKVEGLRAQLELINIDPRKIEEGHISSSASVYAPINGFVAHVDFVLGQFVWQEDNLVDIIDTDLLQLNIHVFERDLKNMVPDQDIIFYDPNNTEQMYQAILTHVGKSIDQETKAIQCIARIVSDKKDFVNGLFVEAEVVTCEREALAIPKEAFVEEDGIHYVLVLQSKDEESMYFKKTPVRLGVVQGEFGEVLEEGLKDILVEGGYNVLSQE